MTTAIDRMADFYELLGALCQGSLDAEQAARLEAMVLDDAELRRRYIVYMHVHANAEKTLVHGTPTNGTEERTFEAGVPYEMLHEELPGRAPSDANPPSAIPPLVVQTLPSPLSSVPFSLGGWPAAYLIATLLVAIGLTTAALVRMPQPAQMVGPSDAVRSHHSESQTPHPSSIVARVTGMADCVWKEPGTRGRSSAAANQKSEIIDHKSPLHLGDTLALRSGLLEITYDTGAKVILQGPVAYQVESPAGGYLSVGKLTAKLEQKSEVGSQRSEVSSQRSEPANQKSEITNHQFAVRTPTALVTDLGTEFGVEVSQEGGTEAQVFAGTIRITPPGGRSGSAKQQIVHAGSAVRWDNANNQVTVIEPSERRFVRMLPAQEPTAYNSADDYAKLVLSLRPAAYYRMEPSANPKDRTVVADSASGGHHGTLTSTHELADSRALGRYGRSLRLNGLQYVAVRDVPGTTTRQLSVSAWVFARFVRDWSAIATEHYVDASNPQLWRDSDAWQFNFSTDDVGGDLLVVVNQSNRVGVSLREGSATPLPTGQWQHVAFVADGSTLRLYRNGTEVASTACDGVCVVPSIKRLTIGCKGTTRSWNDSEVSPNHFWRGNIDELAIFNHGLSAGEIRQLFEGRPRESKATASEATEKP